MTLVRLAACSTFAAILALPATVFAQGPNHIDFGGSGRAGAPCWTSDHAGECLEGKLKIDMAKHRLSPARAAALRRRLDAARIEEKKLRETYRLIDADLHG